MRPFVGNEHKPAKEIIALRPIQREHHSADHLKTVSYRPARLIAALQTSPVILKAIIGSIILLALIAALTITALTIGPLNIPYSHTFDALISWIGIRTEPVTANTTETAVVQTIRLPRILLSLTVGAALATAGTIMQAIFRNPMADPGIIGTSAGGALGAVIVIALGLSTSLFLLPIGAFIGSVIALTIVFAIAATGRRFSIATLLLTGVAISSFLSAAVSAVIITTDSITAQREMIFWLAGGFETSRWSQLALSAPVAILGIIIAILASRDLNLLLIGDEEAESLGVRVKHLRFAMITLASILTAVSVAFSGIIAFVGLIVPHAVRLTVGADHRAVMILSALSGGLFMLFADTLARTLLSPAEIRVGVITAFLGAPIFILILLTNKTRAADL